MNPPNGDLSSMLASSDVTVKNTVNGFADLVNFKEVNCPIVTRGGSRRIQINHRGLLAHNKANATSQPIPILPPSEMETQTKTAVKKRWSFHSANQISELLQMDKAIRPITSSSPNKKRKSCGIGFGSEPQDDKQCKLERPLSLTSRNVLSTRQEQLSIQRPPHPQLHRRMSTGRIMTMRNADPRGSSSRGSRQRLMDDYFGQVEPTAAAAVNCYPRGKSKYCKESPPDHLSNMPDEIVLKILKYLPKPALGSLARTSQRFYQVTHDETLWKRLCVIGRTLLPEHLVIIMSRKPVYLRLARAWIPDPNENPTPEEIERFAAISQLIYLDLTSASVSPLTLAFMMRISPKLVKLSLENLVISKDVLEAMMGFAEKIEALNLTMCIEVNSGLFIKFLTKCIKLSELNISCMKCDWSRDEITSVVSALPSTLSQLNISGYRHILDNDHVSLIAERCPNLIELDISDSQELSGKSLEHVLQLRNLVHLGLSRCYGIEPPTYTVLAGHKSLKYLNLFTLFNEASQRRLSLSLPGIEINKFPYSAIARPTVGNKRSSIWLQRVRD